MSTMGSTAGGGGSTAPASTGGGGGGSTVSGSTIAALMGWGDDWRNRMAAGSTDMDRDLAQLGRYESPEQVWKKARELERRMSAGEFKTALKPGASQDEIARWRAENGLPVDSKGYKVNMPQGKTMDKDDEPFVQAFMKSAHEANFSQSQVDTALANFYGEVDRQEKALTEAEQQAVQKTDELLRTKWGADYSLNKNLVEAFLSRAPAGFKDRFWNGYLADHMPIRASPEMLEWIVQAEREINPAASVVPAGGTNIGQTIEAEMTELKKLMADDKSKYYKGPEAEKLQARYRTLLAAQEGLRKKAGAPA